MAYYRCRSEPGIGPPQLFGHVRVKARQALHMRLVEERVLPGRARWPVVVPAEGGVDHLAAARPGRDRADDHPGVRIEQGFQRIESMLRPLRSLYAVRIKLAGTRVGKVAVPDEVGALGKLDALDLAAAFR